METVVFVLVIAVIAWIIYYNKKYGSNESRGGKTSKVASGSSDTKLLSSKPSNGSIEQIGVFKSDENKERELEESRQRMIDSLNRGEIPEDSFLFPKEKSPFLLTKNERFIMGWVGIQAYTTKTRTRMVGGSAGVSVRVMKGVTIRTGQARGQAERYDSVEDLGRSIIFVTDRNLYVQASNGRVKKCPTSQIVAVQRTTNGLQVEFNRLLPLSFEIYGKDRELMVAALSYYVRFMAD